MVAAALMCLFVSPLRAAPAPPPKPNVIFILADDLGYGDLGCFGQKQIRTPNIDALAAKGLRFTSCYAGSTVCAPSRCCLMTGKHTGHSTIRGNVANATLSKDDFTLAELFKHAGYSTALIGKWGCGEEGSPGIPTKKGFDQFYGYLNQTHAHNYYPTFLWRNETREKLTNVVPNEKPTGAGVASEKLQYSDDLFADEAIKFLDGHKDQPFFLYLPFTIPHANNEGKQNGLEVPDDGPYAEEKDWPVNARHYAAMVSRLDDYVGRIVARLETLRLDENTLIVFASDNGPHKEGGNDPEFFHSRGPLRGIKRDLYEGGIRIPMIVSWPGKFVPGQIDEPIAFWDILPTAAELTGQPVPEETDGVSLLSAFGGNGPNLSERFLYWEFKEGKIESQAIRLGRWKYIRPAKDAAWELYDLSDDLGETKNLAAEQPAVVDKFQTYLKTARTEPKP
jgi:arylsulfatase A-like enzyme